MQYNFDSEDVAPGDKFKLFVDSPALLGLRCGTVLEVEEVKHGAQGTRGALVYFSFEHPHPHDEPYLDNYPEENRRDWIDDSTLDELMGRSLVSLEEYERAQNSDITDVFDKL